jgi:DNA-directed RNA polymerase subunit RPC12/RpoP
MSDRSHDLLVRGIAAAKGNSKEEARFYLEWVLRSHDAEPNEQVEANRYLSQIAEDPKEKRSYLEQVLASNPMDPEARRALAVLKGELVPADIVDPDRMPAPLAPAVSKPAQARRFVCPQCGGKMEFTPDGNALHCQYCGHKQSIIAALDQGVMTSGRDFAVVLATAKGHSAPVATQSLRCKGCGASFVLPPQTLSSACPYCASAYVVEQKEMRDLVPPEAIIPFEVTQDQAQRAVLGWYRAQGFKVLSVKALPSGVYLPVWSFQVGGEISWNCQVEESEQWVPQNGSQVVYEKDLLVAASHTLSAAPTEEINSFPLDHLVPYDSSYLADWPAETYQISVGDASLVAQWRILARARPQVQADISGTYKDLQLSPTRLVIETYRLILLPLWIARYRLEKNWFAVAVNGQNGSVRGDKPRKGVTSWLSSLLAEDQIPT